MNINSEQAERWESLKAGTLAALSLSFAFISTTAVNHLFLAKYFVTLGSLRVELVNWQWLTSGSLAAICGLLFGVTYRYVIRDNDNYELRASRLRLS